MIGHLFSAYASKMKRVGNLGVAHQEGHVQCRFRQGYPEENLQFFRQLQYMRCSQNVPKMPQRHFHEHRLFFKTIRVIKL